MSRFFRWCMRHGAAFLFALALIQILAVAVPWLWSIMESNRAYADPHRGGVWELALLFSALNTAVLPFLGALLIDRLDRWLALKPEAEAAE